MKTARVYLPKERLCESSGPYVKPVKNLFRSPATSSDILFRVSVFLLPLKQ